MATSTAKRSRLDELADNVETVGVHRHPEAPTDASEEAAANAEREANIERTMRERQVPRAVALIMVDLGYSRGTAFRIFNDDFKRRTRAREAAHAAEQAAKAGQPGKAASSTA